MTSSTELQQLDNIAQDSWYCRGVNRSPIGYCFQVFRRHLVPGSILELGPAEGVMTEHLATVTDSLTVVEGAASFCESLANAFPKATVVHSLFEDFAPKQKYDNIVLGHVLEHVDDPAGVLAQAKGWLTDGGRFLAAVPNSRSLHRQAAVLLGLLPFEESMNDSDIHHGHRRVFNPESFRQVFNQAGLKIEVFGGYWLKPLANSQIEASWTPEMLDAFMQLGERYPDIAGEIYVIASYGR